MNIFLYLLLSKAGDAFKIGLSTNPVIRSTMLETPVSLEGSVAFPISDGNALKVEKTLHYLFRKENRPMPHGDGYTEWFGIEVRGDVVNFIERHRARLGVGTAIPLKKGDSTANGGRRDHVRKQRSRQEIWDERRALASESNRRAVECLRVALDQFRKADFSDLSCDAGTSDGPFIGMTFSGEIESVKSWCTAAQQIALVYDGTKLSGGHAVFGSCCVSGGDGRVLCRIDVFKSFVNEWPTEPSFEFLPEWASVREVLGSFMAFVASS